MKETAYLLQAALIGAWWAGLAFSPAFFSAFQFDGISSTAFWAFFAPDIVLIAVLSAIRAYQKNAVIEYIILGAFGYAALYCCNATMLTGSGYLPTGAMLIGLAYNVFLCCDKFVFRNAPAKNLVGNSIKTIVQIICIWTISLVGIPYVILDAFGAVHFPNAGMRFGLAATLFACFSSLGLTSAYFMVRDGGGTPLPLDQTNFLVVSGPYRYVRNPMAIAGIGQGISVAIVFQSIPILVYALLGAIIWHLVVRPFEERDMTERFGDSYLAYRRRVSCWIPTFQQNG